MDINHLYDRYRNSTGEELFSKIQEDFGPKAEEHLRTRGMLTLNDALKYESDFLNEVLGFRPHPVYSEFGDLVGWICDANKNDISITLIKD